MPSAVSGFAELELVLGHEFRDPRWLLQALTHSSRIAERTADDPPGDNEKLEFLGDAVLELLVSEELVRTFPDWREGQLSKSRSRLVNAASLCIAAQTLGLGKHMRLSRGEEKTGGRSKSAILADAYEAVVAAIYLDAGLDAARRFVRKSLIEGALTAAADALSRPDHKSALQELLQARGMPPCNYRVVEEAGPDHQKTFHVEVCITAEITAAGTGRSKKEAEQAAAVAALQLLCADDEGREQKS